MGKVGFVLLLVGGILVLLMGVNIAIDLTTRALIAYVLNTYLGPHIGIANIGDIVANLLYIITLFGGVVIVVGAIVWFAAGHGCLGFLGKMLVSIGAIMITYQIVWNLYLAWTSGVFSKPLLDIILYFASLGLGFTALVLVYVGSLVGAARYPKKPKPAPAPAESPPATA